MKKPTTIDECKLYLENIRKTIIWNIDLKDELYELNAQMNSVPGIRYDDVRVQSSIKNTQEIRLINIIERKKTINEQYEKNVRKVNRFLTQLDKIAIEYPNGASVILRRYVQLKKWETIGDEMSMTYRNVFYVRDEAIRKLLKTF